MQHVVTNRPGFAWDGQVAVAPGIAVHAHDAYIAGVGIVKPSVMGLYPLADVHGEGEIARGELMRYFAEAAWYPTALLPSQGVHWTPVDDRSADATLTDGALSVTMRITFDDEGLSRRPASTRAAPWWASKSCRLRGKAAGPTTSNATECGCR